VTNHELQKGKGHILGVKSEIIMNTETTPAKKALTGKQSRCFFNMLIEQVKRHKQSPETLMRREACGGKRVNPGHTVQENLTPDTDESEHPEFDLCV